MIRTIYRTQAGAHAHDLPLDQIAGKLKEPGALVWVSLEHTNADELNTVLRDIFHFHPLTIEDCLTPGYQPPKVDDFGDYLFIIALALKPNGLPDELETIELNIFLGRNYVVTSYLAPAMPPVQDVQRRLERDERLLERGADFLCHAILDELVDDYLPLIDQMDEEIELLEDAVLEKPQTRTLQRILQLKHATLTLRRIVSPQRETMNRLSRDEFAQIERQNRIYYRDIYDHLVRIQDLSESLRDLITSALDTYLSATSNRLNEIMKALTIVSTIFLPMSFVAGVYGMNFVFMPEIHWRYGYLMVWIIFIVIFSGMLIWFKRRDWI
jgi:magnesium transporter